MRSEVGEWLATCVGSPICILLLSWLLLIYQSQPSSLKRRIDILTVAIIAQSLAHQLGLLSYAILTLIHPTNFGEICSGLVWLLNSSSILQELTLTSIAIFAAISRKEECNLTKNHLKYHLVCLSVVSGCIGFTGVLNFEPDTCVFLAQEVSQKYGLFINSLRGLLLLTTTFGLCIAIFKDICHDSSSELLQSVSDLSETSSKNFGMPYECHSHQWDPSSGSCTSGSTNSRACLRKKKQRIDETGSKSTVFSILFVCYLFDHLPLLVISIRPKLLGGLCTPQNVATWLPLIKDTLLPVFLAIFDKMFCKYVAKVYTKQNPQKMTHCGIDGKFRHFEQDAEYKLQLNLNHGLKFPLTNGSLYGRLQNYQNRTRTGTILMGIQHQHYPKNSLNDENYGSLPAELTSFASSTFEPKQSKDQKNDQQRLIKLNENLEFMNRRKIGNTDVFGQNMENLVELDEPKKKSMKNLDEIREECPNKKDKLQYNPLKKEEEQELTKNIIRRHQSFNQSKYPLKLSIDSKTYDVKDFLRKEKNANIKNKDAKYKDKNNPEENELSSDDESCDFESGDFEDTMSSCRSISRSCCSVTTVANDDFEFFQRKGSKADVFLNRNDGKINMRSFTPKIINQCWKPNVRTKPEMLNNNTKPIVQSYLKKITPGFSMNDLDKIYFDKNQTNFSITSLKNTLKNAEISYLDSGEIWRHNIAGSAPDFTKIFVTEYI